MYLSAAIALCAILKILGMLEWAPLYRIFLFVPAKVLGFFFSAESVEHLGSYRFPTFILDYSCSGIHFFMIALLLIALKSAPSWRGFLTGVATAYILTLAANTARVALYLKITAVSPGGPWLHETIGTIVFVSFLLTYYLAADALGRRMGGIGYETR